MGRTYVFARIPHVVCLQMVLICLPPPALLNSAGGKLVRMKQYSQEETRYDPSVLHRPPFAIRQLEPNPCEIHQALRRKRQRQGMSASALHSSLAYAIGKHVLG